MKGLRSLIDLPEATYERTLLRHTRFTIVSNNCWGYEIYQRLRRPYNTPFVGNFMFPKCYLKMLGSGFPENLLLLQQGVQSQYLNDAAAYPIGILPAGEEVHFLHERTWPLAWEKWQRRTKRLIADLRTGCPPFLKLCDRDSATADHFRAFYELAYDNAITISTTPFSSANHITVSPSMTEIPSRLLLDGRSLYRRRYEYMDFARWLRTGNFKATAASRLIAFQTHLLRSLNVLIRIPVQQRNQQR